MALEWKHRPGDRCLLVETYAQWYSSLQGPDVGGEDGHFAFTGAEEDTVYEPKGEHCTINGASIILAELCGVLLGLRRAEHFASRERNPNMTTLLCFRNLAGSRWDLGDCTKTWDVAR